MIVLKFKYPEIVTNLPTLGPRLITSLRDKMFALMAETRTVATSETIPEAFPGGAPLIQASVTQEPIRIDGTKIEGYVDAGGPTTTKTTRGGENAGAEVDYAVVQHEGVPHSWTIQPVLYSSAWFVGLKDKLTHRIKGSKELAPGLPRALAFQMGGKLVFARRVEHPPLEARPYMTTALDRMKEKIVSELNVTVVKTLQGR